jgi:hypothetical protein
MGGGGDRRGGGSQRSPKTEEVEEPEGDRHVIWIRWNWEVEDGGDGGAAQLPAEGIEARQPEMAGAAVESARLGLSRTRKEGRASKQHGKKIRPRWRRWRGSDQR